jgi:hypothetical protein
MQCKVNRARYAEACTHYPLFRGPFSFVSPVTRFMLGWDIVRFMTSSVTDRVCIINPAGGLCIFPRLHCQIKMILAQANMQLLNCFPSAMTRTSRS